MNFFQPQTRILGARPALDEVGLQQIDERGNPVWIMPKPTKTVEHERFKLAPIQVDGKIVRVKKSVPIQVPVYRGMSASMARYMRSQMRRMLRKQAEQEAQKERSDGTTEAEGRASA